MKKKILKLLFFILIFGTFFLKNSFAEESCESCLIRNEPAGVLLDYIENNKKIVGNISSLLKGSKKVNNYQKVIFRVKNALFTWAEFKAGFKTFLASIDGDTPEPLKRDFMLLNQQNEALNAFLEKIASNGQNTATEPFNSKNIKKLCEGIKSKTCESTFGGRDLEEVIILLIRNNNNISLLLRKEVGIMGMKGLIGDMTYDELILVPENFKQEFKRYYNKRTYSACAKCKGGSIYKTRKIIDKIVLNDKEGKKGIDNWKEAWALLLEIGDGKEDSEKYREEERKLLEGELHNKGVSVTNGESVLKGLKDFNNDGLNSKNNPITNSFRVLQEQLTPPAAKAQINKLDEIWANISDGLNEVSNSNSLSRKEISLGEISNILNKIYITDNVSTKIDSLIKESSAILNRENLNTSKLEGRIIQMHINLIQAVNKLDQMIPKAEKICRDQDSGNSVSCSFRN